MTDQIPKCNSCGQSMFEVGGIGKHEQLGEYRKDPNSEYSLWHETGVREHKLYQCPECKDIKIK